MRVILTNFGTTGDLQPFLALGVELRRLGHQPVLAFSPGYGASIARLGLDFCPIEPDLQDLQQLVNAAWIERPEVYGSMEQMSRLLEPLVAALPGMFEQLRAACRDADALICGPAQPAGRMVHETTGLPFVSVHLSHFGGSGAPALQRASASLINPFRLKLKLPPLRDPLTIDANSPQLALYAMSRHVFPPPAYWPSHYHMTGYFFLDHEDWRPEPDLVDFFNSGRPPVVVTFGSMGMTHENPDELTDLVIDAVNKARCRAILQQSRNSVVNRQLTSDVYAIGYAPHGWLFSRAACIVHHGGGGTAGAVFRSGVPSIFVPHGRIFDQHYWAQLAREIGCAGPAIPYTQLTADRLNAEIVNILNTPSYLHVASMLGEKIRGEHGVKTAGQLIEELVLRIGLNQSKEVPRKKRDEETSRRKEYIQKRRSKRAGKSVSS
jgi:sterol 3beta-glucosyltransferase